MSRRNPGSMQELMGMPEPSLAAREEIARHLSEQGRFEEAIRILQEIVGAGFWDASIVLGNVLSEAGRATEALEAYDVGLEHGDIRCPFNAARTLIDGGRHAEARLMLRRGASLGEPRAVGWLRADARRRKRERRRRG